MKKIIEKRLDLLGVKEWEIRENHENGEIYISIPENKYADEIISQMTTVGDFNITDSQHEEEVLIPGNMVKDVKVGLTSQNGSQIVLLNIEFDKEGTKKLQEISKIYNGETEENISEQSEKENQSENTNEDETKDAQENNNEDNEEKTKSGSDDTDKTKKVNLVLDGEKLLTTYFSEEITNGVIQLSMGNSSTNFSNEQLQNYLKQASNLAVLMETEKLPIKYVQDTNLYLQSEYNSDTIKNFIIIGISILAVAIIFTIVNYKKSGLLLMISLIGFIATLLLIIRYTNVILSITGVISIILSIVISYIFLMKLLKTNKTEENAFHKVALEYLTICIPALIIAVVFSFVKYLPIASFGMVMFYSIMLMIIYHGIVTRNLIEKSENKW